MWIPVPSSFASAASLAQQLLGGERQPLDADEDLDRPFAAPCFSRNAFSLSASVSRSCSSVATSFERTARMPIFSAASASASSWRYMSLTAWCTPHLIDSL